MKPLISLAAAFLSVTAYCFGQEAEHEKLERLTAPWRQEPLHGRPSIEVAVVSAESGYGLSEPALRDATELILRRNSIPVLRACGDFYSNCHRLLALVDRACSPEGLCAYRVELSLLGYAVQLRRLKDPAPVYVRLWSKDDFGIIGRSNLHHLKATLVELLESFAQDYFKANEQSGS